LNAYLLCHHDDLQWVREANGLDAPVIAHEDYISLLLDEFAPCFFKHNNDVDSADETINYLSFNWHRDEEGRDLCLDAGFSIAEAFSTGVLINIASICREYFALKYWCDRYDCVYVSCNESARFLEVAKKFGHRVQVYDPGHRRPSLLSSLADRVLSVQPIARRANFLRNLQTPFIKLLRNKTLTLNDWTLRHFTVRQIGWICENSRKPWKGAYSRTLGRKYLLDAEECVPKDFQAMFAPAQLVEVLERIDVCWDSELIVLLSETMTDRYRLYRDYFVSMVALYQDMLDSYRPAEFVISSEFYEPYVIAAQLASKKGIKISWLVDGYPIVAIPKRIGKASLGSTMFDRIYAIGCQHQFRLLKDETVVQEIVTIVPPILDMHSLHGKVEKHFDAIIMTWIPNDLGIDGRNGSRPNTLLEAVRAAMEAGMKKLAIKIKHHSEKEWLLPILEKAGYIDKVTILEGRFSEHVTSAYRIIGGISSAVGETAYHNIPYYIYEPVANGYSAEQIASAVVIAEGGVARTPAELHDLLKRPEGSVISDRPLLFGTECQHAEWSWEQTRELYTSWAARWGDLSGIKTTLQWRGFPLWWASNLIAKDTAVDYAWYQELHNRLRGMPEKRFKPRSDVAIYLGLVKSLLEDVGKWLLLRFLPSSKKVDGGRVWFHSLEYNLINAREGFCDRMYEQTPLDDQKFGLNSSHIVRLTFKRRDFFNPWLWRRKISGYTAKLKRDVEILDRYMTLRDIIGIHTSLVINYVRFKKLIKPLRSQGVRIGHAEFVDILLLEMQKSLLTILPWSMSYAAMVERWVKSSGGRQILVTYAETLAAMRPVYFVTHKHSPDHLWISIQHATIYKNKMGLYHRFSEFHIMDDDVECNISPMPDYYFVHGLQFSDILSEFYPPEKIRTIGCLKYDSLHRAYGKGPATPQMNNSGRILLLAPSVGDEEIILKMFSGLRDLPRWKIMLSKHPAVSQEWVNELIRRHDISLTIEFDPTKSTIQLVENASMVICANSGIALESYLVGVPSVRVLNPRQPPVVEDEPGIKYVTTQEELLRAISDLGIAESFPGLTPEISNTLYRYFYQFDGLASHRFWTELGKLPDLSHKWVAAK
jgi:hypothetical protein